MTIFDPEARSARDAITIVADPLVLDPVELVAQGRSAELLPTLL